LREWMRLCSCGRIYKELAEPGESKKQVKLRVLIAFYRSGKWKRFPNLMWRRLRRRFPTVMGVLLDLKKKEHRRAAWLMQNFESTLFIYRICNRIKGERPDVPLLTKHDALGTTPEFLDYVESVIRDEFRRLGVEVKLRREVP
jgi:hypothetical protein